MNNKVSIITTMTDPDSRKDPWKEALQCYNDIADEVIIVGEDWPDEFDWSHIGKTFQEGFDKATGDWVIRMDLDYFFHENDIAKIRKMLKRFKNYPIVSFPQYQFFSKSRRSLRTLIGIAVNKSSYPEIKLDGGGDLCLPTLNNNLLNPFNNPISKYPLYQYDSFFRNKDLIAFDRARFSRAWFREFGNYGDRGGPTETEAYEAWLEMIKNKINNHIYSFNPNKHPKYIKERIKNIEQDAFGSNVFGIEYPNRKIMTLFSESKKILKIFLIRKFFEIKTI
jgi:hypothetical protein